MLFSFRLSVSCTNKIRLGGALYILPYEQSTKIPIDLALTTHLSIYLSYIDSFLYQYSKQAYITPFISNASNHSIHPSKIILHAPLPHIHTHTHTHTHTKQKRHKTRLKRNTVYFLQLTYDMQTAFRFSVLGTYIRPLKILLVRSQPV